MLLSVLAPLGSLALMVCARASAGPAGQMAGPCGPWHPAHRGGHRAVIGNVRFAKHFNPVVVAPAGVLAAAEGLAIVTPRRGLSPGTTQSGP